MANATHNIITELFLTELACAPGLVYKKRPKHLRSLNTLMFKLTCWYTCFVVYIEE